MGNVRKSTSYGEKVMRKFSYTIKEEQGIHARPASFLIQDVMCGQKVEVEICGNDEKVAYRGMKKFFEENL